MASNKEEHSHKLTSAYHTMLKHFKEALHEIGHETGPIIHTAIDMAKDKTMLIEELTEEEAEKVANYLKRDVQDAASFMLDVEDVFKNTISFDIKYIENRLLDAFTIVADQTKLDMMKFNQKLSQSSIYETGDVFGVGTLQCKNCQHLEHFHEIKTIPECSKCGGTTFERHLEVVEGK